MPANWRPSSRASAAAARGDRWALALEEGKLLAAVNQTLTTFDHPWPAATKWRSSAGHGG
jgi:hypothetical protein